ncbi:MAG: TraR/DksA family transcriptional regulator [Pseudomonadota bacterium]
MSKKIDLAHFRQLLQQRRDDLQALAETSQQASATVELDQSKVGRLSRMDALQAQAMSQETERRHQLELVQIGAALRRIESGDYGYCLECDEPIAEERLAFNPATPLCIHCAERKG